MLNPQEIVALGNASVVAPAGYGKTQLIAEIAALGSRTLILTHTHAGVHAIRERLKKISVPTSKISVDTIAGWSMRYAHAFPRIANPPRGTPNTTEEWNRLYSGACAALGISAVRKVIESSYERILIDEYQDCPLLQHNLVVSLSSMVPTTVFGDPMQGIFEFAGATLSWEDEIFKRFPLATELEVPHRWNSTNPDLGSWIAETRQKLLNGERIDLDDPRINFRVSKDAFDMSILFEGIDKKDGSFAAIHCNKAICYKLAGAARGGYQAIEEMAANRIQHFASDWDSATGKDGRKNAIVALIKDSFHQRKLEEGEIVSADEEAVLLEMKRAVQDLGTENYLHSAQELLILCRRHPRWRLYRSGLWRDAERSVQELIASRHSTMAEAANAIRQRASHTGRRLPTRTVSTPLLLKGLEFSHVIVPMASHFATQSAAQAKLFYVAISRAKHSLTISSTSRYIQFDKPKI